MIAFPLHEIFTLSMCTGSVWNNWTSVCGVRKWICLCYCVWNRPAPWTLPPPLHRHGYHSSSNTAPNKNPTDLKLHLGNPSQHASDPVVIHAGAVLAMLDLLASISSDAQPEVHLSALPAACLIVTQLHKYLLELLSTQVRPKRIMSLRAIISAHRTF